MIYKYDQWRRESMRRAAGRESWLDPLVYWDIKSTRFARAYGKVDEKATPSRNKREGRYMGKHKHHYRVGASHAAAPLATGLGNMSLFRQGGWKASTEQ